MLLRPRSRTLKSFVLRALMTRVVPFVAVAAMVLLGRTLGPDQSAQLAETATSQTPTPTWTAADWTDHPECVPSAEWPTGTPAGFVVVQAVGTTVHTKLAFDRAWEQNHNASEVDDVWVVGVCG
jgi:hypothetical protein